MSTPAFKFLVMLLNQIKSDELVSLSLFVVMLLVDL